MKYIKQTLGALPVFDGLGYCMYYTRGLLPRAATTLIEYARLNTHPTLQILLPPRYAEHADLLLCYIGFFTCFSRHNSPTQVDG
jgi:hypothetical protein